MHSFKKCLAFDVTTWVAPVVNLASILVSPCVTVIIGQISPRVFTHEDEILLVPAVVKYWFVLTVTPVDVCKVCSPFTNGENVSDTLSAPLGGSRRHEASFPPLCSVLAC